MDTLIWFLWYLVQIVVLFQLIFPVLLWALWLVFRRKHTLPNPAPNQIDYAVIVTAYEYTNTLAAAVESILKADYENYIVYIVADKCDTSNLVFNDSRILILTPPEILGSNTASHNYAVSKFIRKHDRLTIIDSDNLVHPQYFNELNLFSNELAIQGVRAAKNLNTTIACLDAARDMYYHFYDGQILYQLGSSATLSGSGMAFEVEFYTTFLKNNKVIGAGFDKVLQNYIVSRGIRIAFSANAIVYDEKTSKSDQLIKQRARWINTWFKYFKYGFSMAYNGITGLDRNQFLFGLILLRPPLFLFLIASVCFLLVNSWIDPLMAIVWLVGLLLFVTGFFISLFYGKANDKIYRSLINIPYFVYHQVISLLKSKSANKHSVATNHYHSQSIGTLKENNDEN
ncbi:glycosyltransferase [Pedobacter ginsengisoli]|uniref:glycosyltransferase n=1 Tax=Pedobacter ginsengisoli TaxID=363852 RepID=UPI00254EA4C3|nr:glycosyltransferase [Pedobacter ginsengisoli]